MFSQVLKHSSSDWVNSLHTVVTVPMWPRLSPVVNVVVLLQRTLRPLDQLGHTGAEVVTHLLSLLVRRVVILAIIEYKTV